MTIKELFRNPGHHFGYIQLPGNLDVDFPEDKEAMCWDSFNLINREIFASEVDVMLRIGKGGAEVYLGKAIELKTSKGMHYLRLDTSNCAPSVFNKLVEYYKENCAVYHPRPFLVSMHIDPFITDVMLRASTLHNEEGTAYDTVLNMVVITLLE